MGSNLDIFDKIAADIGVSRFKSEEDESYCRRVTYSAAKYWICTFCMDDGAEGKEGLTKQAINKRIKTWIIGISDFCPNLLEWFCVNEGGLQYLYNRLIDAGDLVHNGFTDKFITVEASKKIVSNKGAIVTGLFDPTTASEDVCKFNKRELITTGLATFVPAGNNDFLEHQHWWSSDLVYMLWEPSVNYEGIKYIDLHSSKWNVNRQSAWTETPNWVDNLTLAGIDISGNSLNLYIAKHHKNKTFLSPITWNQAQEFYFYARKFIGNQVVSTFQYLDEKHTKICLPIGFIPGNLNRFLDVLSWPVDNIADRFNRIIRTEAFPSICELLQTCYIDTKESVDGR